MTLRHVAAALAMLTLVVGTNTRVAAQAAPSPEALQVAQELTSVVGASTMAEMLKNLNDKVWPNVEAAIRRQHPNADAATMTEIRQEFERQQMATVQDTMKDAAAIYARHLSVAEMRAMVAFYKSPAGAKALAVMPAITSEMQKTMAPRMQGLQAKLTLAYLDILQKKGLSPR